LSLNQETLSGWQTKWCQLSAGQLSKEQVVLHGNHLLRMKGELVHEFKCERVEVVAQEGFQAEGDHCLDHLPVYTEAQELMYLSPLTRLLVPRGAVCRG